MSALLTAYAEAAGNDAIAHLRQLAHHLEGRTVVHVNSTRAGGGVAEILHKLIPLKRELGINAQWEVIEGDPDFYACTKSFHNGLQGTPVVLTEALLEAYKAANIRNASRLRDQLEAADFVFIHDPQPAALLSQCPGRKGKWIWRCHIDASKPYRPVWKFLQEFVRPYDASIFSLVDFAQPLGHPQYLIPPSIDPLAEKNIDLSPEEVRKTALEFGLDLEAPLILQVSRFDRFKDPIGVIQAYRLARHYLPGLQLVLAGGGADDDPEGEAVLAEVRRAADDDPNVKILLLPSDAHRTINALQRAADIVLQKSLREGFGLTVTEAMWKERPVIGGDTGGIRLQVVNGQTGHLVRSPEGAALRIRHMIQHPHQRAYMGRQARRFVRENFLLTRHLREYMTLMVALQHSSGGNIEL